MRAAEIVQALAILRRGGVIAYPTDTTYGIGCDALNLTAVRRIFELKGRDFSKPLSLAFADTEMLGEFTNTSGISPAFLDEVFPGPVTLLLPKREAIDGLVTAGSDKVGARIPGHPELLSLIKELGHPIVTTSANFSGEKDPVAASQINLPVDFVLEGECNHKAPSTIVDLQNKKIVRPGVDEQNYLELIEKYL